MRRRGLCSDLHLVIETSRFILPRAGTPMECEVPDNMAGVVIIVVTNNIIIRIIIRYIVNLVLISVVLLLIIVVAVNILKSILKCT